ncbi:antimicrobial peptide NK-lysin-like [Balearica regulorum gibbericeps]|uniref:antimicrobial peptide NK-lysin-like n=1 Tax=Balearica regulorum gibbericeps TaxID=100784 RepID=UPI003F60C495
MAAAFLLVLVAVRAAWAAVPEPCQGGPASWCQDVATAVECRREQYCHDLWDSLAAQDAAEGDAEAPGKGIKCGLCTKILKKIQAMAGDDPDEAAVDAALGKACRALGKMLGRVCKQLLAKYRDQISEALQNRDQPRDICATIGFCKA